MFSRSQGQKLPVWYRLMRVRSTPKAAIPILQPMPSASEWHHPAFDLRRDTMRFDDAPTCMAVFDIMKREGYRYIIAPDGTIVNSC